MSFDLIVKGGTLPDGRIADIGISGEPHRRHRPRLDVEAARVDRCRRRPRRPALRRPAFPHGRDAFLRPAAHQRVRYAARRHRALGRAEAVAHPRSDARTRARLLRLGGVDGPARHPHAMSTPATTGCSPSKRCSRSAGTSRPISTSSSSPSRRTASTARRTRGKTRSARSTWASTSSAASRISSGRWKTDAAPLPNSARSRRNAA